MTKATTKSCVHNIPLTDEGISIFYPTTQDISSTSASISLFEFHLHNVSENVLILPIEFQAKLGGKPAVKYIQVCTKYVPKKHSEYIKKVYKKCTKQSVVKVYQIWKNCQY